MFIFIVIEIIFRLIINGIIQCQAKINLIILSTCTIFSIFFIYVE